MKSQGRETPPPGQSLSTSSATSNECQDSHPLKLLSLESCPTTHEQKANETFESSYSMKSEGRETPPPSQSLSISSASINECQDSHPSLLAELSADLRSR